MLLQRKITKHENMSDRRTQIKIFERNDIFYFGLLVSYYERNLLQHESEYVLILMKFTLENADHIFMLSQILYTV